MEQGRNQDAVQVLRQAVQELSTWVNQECYQDIATVNQEVVKTSSSGCTRPWHGSSSALLGQGSGSISSHMIHQHAVPLSQLCNGRDIYNCAFHLPYSDEVIMSKSLEYRTQAIAIVLYNIALASHRYGIQSGISQPLVHATVAYKQVLDLVGHNALHRFPKIAVMFLVIIGNLANIHLELRQIPEFMSARSCLRELMCNIRLDQMSRQDFGFFNMQLFCFDRETTWYAPAA